MQIIFNLIKIIIISHTSNDLSRYFFHFDITLHKKKRYNCHITFKILLISNYKKLSFQITLLQIWLYELLRTIQTSATTNYSSIPRFGLVLQSRLFPFSSPNSWSSDFESVRKVIRGIHKGEGCPGGRKIFQ